MDLIGNYGSDSEEGDAQGTAAGSEQRLVRKPQVNAAPAVQTVLADAHAPSYMDLADSTMSRNLRVEDMYAPVLGPEHPTRRRPVGQAAAGKQTLAGHVEPLHMDHHSFHREFSTRSAAIARQGSNGAAAAGPEPPRKRKKKGKDLSLEERLADVEVGDLDGFDVWAPDREGEEDEESRRTDVDRGTASERQLSIRLERLQEKRDRAEKKEEVFEQEEEYQAAKKAYEAVKAADGKAPAEGEGAEGAGSGAAASAAGAAAPVAAPESKTRSRFLGASEFDYQGRPWTTPPSTLPEPDRTRPCYLPKRCIHTWSGHSKGVQSIEFSPRYGHLLLSGSMDGTARVWDVLGDRSCMRTYEGHSAAVRQARFAADGASFATCSFDRTVKLWDVETGQCKKEMSNGKMMYCAEFAPTDPNMLLCGSGNRKIVQFDLRTGQIAQEYDHHLSSVNTVTFFDGGRRFATTSDDKKMLIWEFNIPVPIKYISEPHMHSMPAVTLSPDKSMLACQSLDNKILCFSVKQRIYQLRKKTFSGHVIAGYACQVGFATNGKFIFSGDSTGNIWFWDWRSGKKYRKFHAHNNGPCIGAVWHPVEQSKVATCGWDGLIKLWD